jgi:hypothetical protein
MWIRIRLRLVRSGFAELETSNAEPQVGLAGKECGMSFVELTLALNDGCLMGGAVGSELLFGGLNHGQPFLQFDQARPASGCISRSNQQGNGGIEGTVSGHQRIVSKKRIAAPGVRLGSSGAAARVDG